MDNSKSDSIYKVFHQVMGLHYYRTHKLLEKQGVYPGQPPMLFALGRQDGQSQKELAEKLNIKPATVTMMVKRMANAGLIERRQDDKDQRVSRVYLTHKGREVKEKVAEVVKDIEEECFNNFTDEEKEMMSSLLLKMRDNLLSVCGDRWNMHLQENCRAKNCK